MWGQIIFPRAIVVDAIAKFDESQKGGLRPDPNTGYMRMPFPMEICRFEIGQNDGSTGAPHAMDLPVRRHGKWATAGALLEVIGLVSRFWIDGNMLMCAGVIEEGLCWPVSLSDHAAIPYMDMKFLPGTRTVFAMSITEIVLSQQVVTSLALRKYHERKSILSVDSQPKAE
jgi:hypothetical protein